MNMQSGKVADGFFDGHRENGAPTYYEPNVTPYITDIQEAGIYFASVILALGLFSILPGVHGFKAKCCSFLWIVIAVGVSMIIALASHSDQWETAEIATNTKYKAGTGAEIRANIGLHIGLNGINITLKGDPVNQLNETINYNEHFTFSTRQGRLGFGPFANNLNQEYRASQFRGLPLPILWVCEYFTLDGEAVRWGRHFRESGFYAGNCLWMSLGLWILTNILLFILMRYAAYMSILTGLLLGIACAIKHYLRNELDLVIPFSTQHKLQLRYGVAFWACLITGGLCLFWGTCVLFLDLIRPYKIAVFFNKDKLKVSPSPTPPNQRPPKSSTDASFTTTSTSLSECPESDDKLTEVVSSGGSRDKNESVATPRNVTLLHAGTQHAVSSAGSREPRGNSSELSSAFRGVGADDDWTGQTEYFDWDWSSDSELTVIDSELDEDDVETAKQQKRNKLFKNGIKTNTNNREKRWKW